VHNPRSVGVGRIRQGIVALLVGATASGAGASPASAFTAVNGAAATPFAVGFAVNPGTAIGPFGVATDPVGRVLVTAQDDLYRFGVSGGTADASTRVNGAPIGRGATGIAFGHDGRLYVSRHTGDCRGDVVELDPVDGSVRRSVSEEIPCPTALATDPLTGDLFVSTIRGGEFIGRIADPETTTPSGSVFLAGIDADGLTFGPDGTLYVAHHADPDGTTVSAVGRDGARRPLAAVPEADGVALGAPERAGGPPPFIVANRRDGRITKVDLATRQQTDLVVEGSRGDLIAVGADGCLYATQTDTVLKVTNAGGACRPAGGAAGGSGGSGGSASGLALGAGLSPTSVPVPRALRGVVTGCPRGSRVTVRLGFRGQRLRFARVYVGGKRVRTVRGRALRRSVRVTSRLPTRAFTVTVRATTRSGRRLIRRTRYAACGRPLPRRGR
jgi:hypothetical protein